MYDEKLKKLKEEQMNVVMQIEDHTKAGENWHLTASRVLDIAQRAVEIFNRSEPNEKRQFLNYLLQHCRLSGKNLVFELRNPFDSIALYANHSTILALLDDFRTFDWAEEYKYPTVTLAQMNQLLAECREDQPVSAP